MQWQLGPWLRSAVDAQSDGDPRYAATLPAPEGGPPGPPPGWTAQTPAPSASPPRSSAARSVARPELASYRTPQPDNVVTCATVSSRAIVAPFCRLVDPADPQAETVSREKRGGGPTTLGNLQTPARLHPSMYLPHAFYDATKHFGNCRIAANNLTIPVSYVVPAAAPTRRGRRTWSQEQPTTRREKDERDEMRTGACVVAYAGKPLCNVRKVAGRTRLFKG